MSDGQIASLLLGLLMLVLVGSSLVSRRLPIGTAVRYALAWAAIFVVGLVLFSFREEAGSVVAKVQRELSGENPVTQGEETRILRGTDGHFNVNGQLNGRSVRFLVDTGATSTVVSRAVANGAGIAVDENGFGVVVETANGVVTMRRARVGDFRIGSINRQDMPVLVADGASDLNVLGMSFLSSLRSWRVEGREMIFVP